MRRGVWTLGVMCIAWFTSGCPSGSDGTGPGRSDRTISSATEAQAAFTYLKALAEYVDQDVPTNFSGPLSVSGAAGTASVSGRKTSSSSSSSSSTSTTRTSDLMLDFASFRSSPGGMTASGRVDWYDYYYSRTACSISTCASASDHSEALEGSSISVTFEYNGDTYSDQIDVDASSGSDTSSWSVTVTNRAGQSFSFTYR